MREIDAIIRAYDQACEDGLECILATVVHVEGSSYRKAGARMLVDENGLMTGAISGGCLEGDALRKALHALHQQQNKLITYDTSDEDDAIIGAQLGCNGVIQVLFEPILTSDQDNPIALLRKVTLSDQPGAIVSLFNLNKSATQPGTKALFSQEMSISTLEDSLLANALRQAAIDTLTDQQSHFVALLYPNQEHIHAFIEYYTPPPQLVLVGAGNDAQILAQMASHLGWKITVTDGRSSHANASRFVSSCQIIVSKPAQILEGITLTSNTYFVLMSHNYQYDLTVLRLLIDQPVISYIGLLGPKSKFDRMLRELQESGILLSEAQQKKIFTPVGLNIGAETPAEIALSILAEIQTQITHSKVVSLRDKNGPIHDKKHPDFKTVQL